MAEVNIDVAKEASVQTVNATVNTVNTNVQAVNTKVGTSSDTASSTPTTLFAGIKGLIGWFTGTWTAARAGYIDTVNTNTAYSASASSTGTLSQKLAYIISTLIGATSATGGTTTAGTAMAKLNAILTNTIVSNFVYVSSNNVKSVQLNSVLVAPSVGESKIICNFLPKANGNIKVTVNVFLSGGTHFTLGILPYVVSGTLPQRNNLHSFYTLPVGTTFNPEITDGNSVSISQRSIPVTSGVYNNNYSFSIPVIKGFPIMLTLLGSYGGECNYCSISYDEVK